MDNIPAKQIKLYGKQLIEAAAGTGKTWTLTGIILRLLLQSQHLPKHIIATTFTVKAATELRKRIQERFNDFYILCQFFSSLILKKQINLKEDLLLLDDVENFLRLAKESSDLQIQKAAADEINQFIFIKAAQAGINGIIQLLNKVEAVRVSLDELFTGTLDSLCNKWLKEFSIETSNSSNINFVENETASIKYLAVKNLKSICQNIEDDNDLEQMAYFVSDLENKISLELSNKSSLFHKNIDYSYYSNKEHRNNLLREIQEEKEKLKSYLIDFHHKIKSVEFLNLLEGIEEDNFPYYEQVLSSFEKHFNKNKVKKSIEKWHIFFNLLKKNKLNYQLYKTEIKILTGEYLNKTAKTEFEELKTNPKWQNIFNAVEKISQYFEIKEKYSDIDKKVKELSKYCQAELSENLLYKIQDQYADYLESNSQTSYSAQINKFNTALKTSDQLAKYISYHYPVMLVDESQDLNSAQLYFLEKIYIENLATNGFFMPVGDPKQAIYLFRGGDVNNYNKLKKHFDPQEIYKLDKSYRSTPNIINALNSLYSKDKNLGENIEYFQMLSADIKPQILKADGSVIEDVIKWCEIKKEDELEEILNLVEYLCSKNSQYKKLQNNELIPISPADILILMSTNSSLKKLSDKLSARNIANEYVDKKDLLFAQDLSRAVLFLFEAFFNPENKKAINSLLTSILFNKNETELADFNQENQFRDIFIQKLRYAHNLWQHKQLARALQYFCTQKLFDKSIWERLAEYPYPQNLRYLMDLRQIQEIVNNYGRKLTAANFLCFWREQCNRPEINNIKTQKINNNKNAINLMTIHSAKGLESPIVIIAGLSAANNKNADIFHKHRNKLDEDLILSAKIDEESQFEQMQKEQNEELKRLFYVAITRSSDLNFIFYQVDKENNAKFYSLNKDNLNIAKRLDLLENQEDYKQQEHILSDKIELNEAESVDIREISIREEILENKYEGWKKTSFSSLAHNKIDYANLADFNFENTDEEFDIEEKNNLAEIIQNSFPKGTSAGVFLHKVLEQYRVYKKDNLLEIIENNCNRYAIDLTEKQKIETLKWIDSIYQSKLSFGDFNLANINNNYRSNEMSFNLAVNYKHYFNIDKLNKIMEKWGKDIYFDYKNNKIAFLRGEIDLSFLHNNKYYIIDYKSNYLGLSVEDYSIENMHKQMDKHGYWLQALIYQTALHRLLSKRLLDYSPEKHLGTVEYLFLRAIGRDKEKQYDVGHLNIDIPLDILLEFNDLLLQ